MSESVLVVTTRQGDESAADCSPAALVTVSAGDPAIKADLVACGAID